MEGYGRKETRLLSSLMDLKLKNSEKTETANEEEVSKLI